MKDAGLAERVIQLGPGLAAIPERLLLAHAQGRVLFVVGAGVSKQAGMPDFEELVLLVYAEVDHAVHEILLQVAPRDVSTISSRQAAEVRRFESGEFDVVLGMLERRIDGTSSPTTKVRQAIGAVLRDPTKKCAPIHRTLMRLANRGGARTIVTTNFELLLQSACSKSIETYALGGIPRPNRGDDFSGVLHVHGALSRRADRQSDLIVSDRDFGEFYLRRRSVPDFIYDAARLFFIVLVGYRANDPPMRYLFNAVAADGSRFDDLKERFVFLGAKSPDPIGTEDWKARGITPITYDSMDGHKALAETLSKWAALSPFESSTRSSDAVVRRIVKTKRAASTDSDRDLFDHIVRRSNQVERIRIASLAASAGAEFAWLDAMNEVILEIPAGASL